tara:strand:+ start:1276 stop:1812 length:537 start_codon:yes stop_codon:yes gene_type:complete
MSITKKNIKIIFFLFFITLFSSHVKSEIKIAFIQTDFLISESLAGKSLLDQINKIDKKNKKELKKIREKLDSEKKDISQKKNVLSEDEYKKKVISLNKRFQSLQSNAKNKIKALQAIRNKGMSKILNELNIILSEYSIENELTFIIDQKNIIIGKTELNITNEILKLINKKLTQIDIK